MNKSLQFIGIILSGAILIILLDIYRGITSVIDFEIFWRLGFFVILVFSFNGKTLGLSLFYILIVTFYLGFGCIQFKESKNGVEIYSPLGRKIDQAESVDTLYLRNDIYDEYGSISTSQKVYYFTHSKDTVKVYNRLRKILSFKGQFSILQKQMSNDVSVDLIKDANGTVYSLDGDIVDEKWKPRRIVILPLEHNNSW